MTAGENKNPFRPYKSKLKISAGIALVSAIYFADVFLRASRKYFWFDELLTTYLCRFHDFKGTWSAVLHGADFNPPLLYLLTRCAQRFFGEGLIATRLPAMVGVWLFGVCLFFFVAKRAGKVSGFIAGVFPFFTLAEYYAYEARPHGVVLGWCGLTLVCWQRSAEGQARKLWLAGFGLCLVGALLTHVYAVYILFPFALVEIYNLFHRGRPDWGVVAALVLSLTSVTLTVYLPLFRMYRATVLLLFFPASHDTVQRFLITALGPAIGVFVISTALCALEESWRTQPTTANAAIPTRELLVAAGFACIPLAGVVGSKISHGPFVERYFLSSLAGYAILLGFASSRPRVSSWTARALASCMFLLMIGDLGTTIYLRKMNRIVLTEPSTGLTLSTTSSSPMARYETVMSGNNGLDILVVPSLEYLYFFKYAPPSVVSHLYFGAPKNDVNLGVCLKLAKAMHLDLKTTAFDAFIATHSRFLVYEGGNGENLAATQAVASAGYRLISVRADSAGVMYEYEK